MTALQQLSAKIDNNECRVGVIGLGYVGLPLALGFARKSLQVVGFDVDQRKVDSLQSGKSYLSHISGEEIAKCVENKTFSATADFDALRDVDAIIICVPTPLTPHREPDMRYIESTAEQIVKRLRPGHLVILESTTYPGTTDELLKSRLEASGLKFGEDFLLAFSPEREDPGNANFSTTTIPKVVGGVDEVSAEIAIRLYQKAIAKVVSVSTSRVAEATKLTENIFRAVNIALVNELKVIYDRMGIDVWEVLDACETKPFGFMRFNPGPGLGGHCIPLDPFYLTWKAREFDMSTRFIELAGEINVRMPNYVVQKLQDALNDKSIALKGAKVLLLGLAYKKNVGDTRESPAYEIMEQLLEAGAEVNYHDPFVPVRPDARSWPVLPAMQSVPLTVDTVSKTDAIVLVTDHSDMDYALVEKHARLIIDTRGKFPAESPKVVRA